MNNGMGSVEDQGHDAVEVGAWWQFGPLQRALAGGLMLAVVFGLERAGVVDGSVVVFLYAVSAVVSATHWGVEAVEAAIRRRISIDVLMGVATVGSAVLGLWEEAAFLAFLYGAAEGLEEWTYDRTRGSIRSLLDLAPKQARLIRDGVEDLVPVGELVPGDRFVLLPGESLPTDGKIVFGGTSLDEAVVTGESVPVDKTVDDRVFAGTVNLTGRLEVEATARYEDNTLARIIHLVEEAQGDKTRAQQLIDRFGDRYSPLVLAASIGLMVVPPLFGGDLSEWFRRGVTLAVAGAPCALVMSTPVAVAAAIGSAGKRGILIKGGVHLENLGRVRVVCFDKTGTLTAGVPRVAEIAAADGFEDDEILALAASAEASSEHPLGRAIVKEADTRGLAVSHPGDFEALIGAGVRAKLDGKRIVVGKPGLLTSEGIDTSVLHTEIERIEEQGKTVVAVAVEVTLAGVVALADEPRPRSSVVVESLRRMGIGQVVMLTGDNQRVGSVIARRLSLDQVFTDLSPADKSHQIRHLEETHGPVAMVGDGINDAPALATATVGIAMGAAGTDAAIEAADVALLGDDLNSLPVTVSLGQRVRRISIQNIVFSSLLLAVLVPAAVVGAITVAVAVTVHEVAELIAVANGLRTRTYSEEAVPSTSTKVAETQT